MHIQYIQQINAQMACGERDVMVLVFIIIDYVFSYTKCIGCGKSEAQLSPLTALTKFIVKADQPGQSMCVCVFVCLCVHARVLAQAFGAKQNVMHMDKVWLIILFIQATVNPPGEDGLYKRGGPLPPGPSCRQL